MKFLAFLVGAVLGAFALLILDNLGVIKVQDLTIARAAKPKTTAADPTATEPGAESARLEETPERVAEIKQALEAEFEAEGVRGKNLDPLAVLLEEGRFQRDWAKVAAASDLVRERGAEWVAPETAAPPLAVDGELEKPLPVLFLEASRRKERLDRGARRNAATALMGRSDAEAVQRLIDLFENDPSLTVRRDAAEALARSGDDRALATLIAAVRAPDHATRLRAGEALASAGYLQGLTALIDALKNDPIPDVRADAFSLLVQFEAVVSGENAAAVRALAETLRTDTDPRVRELAAEHLRSIDLDASLQAAQALYEALREDEMPDVRFEVAATLLAYGERWGAPPAGAVRALEAALLAERDGLVRSEVFRGLARFGDRDTLSVLDTFAATASGQVYGSLEEVRGPIRERVGEGP